MAFGIDSCDPFNPPISCCGNFESLPWQTFIHIDCHFIVLTQIIVLQKSELDSEQSSETVGLDMCGNITVRTEMVGM
jgi:hypothetical protein